MRRLALFHYNPIELFPPALNMIRYLSEDKDMVIQVYTTHPPTRIALFSTKDYPGVEVTRIGKDNSDLPLWRRLFSYCWFHFYALLHVLWFRADVVYYIESFSAVIPLLLKRFLKRRIGLCIHYHEYMSPADYSRSFMLRNIHRWEKLMYPRAFWISHTNEERMDMFLRDLGLTKGVLNTRIVPNYPFSSWADQHRKTEWHPADPFRFVYVGAVGLTGLFFKEIFRWIGSMGGRCTLDVYSNQSMEELVSFVENEKTSFISFKSPVPYDELPRVLANYDVGLILYKGDTENFKFNAPNKLFEYLNVGLDVWFPEQMKGVIPYVQTSIHPMVIAVDFANISPDSLSAIYDNKNTGFKPVHYQAEIVYKPLKTAIRNFTS